MSIDINWETLTAGPDGDALAESVRGFIHDRFQAIPLPKLIRSVTVHGFEFGKVAPEIVLKDICDPLPDFYNDADDDGDDEDGDGDRDDATHDGGEGEKDAAVTTPQQQSAQGQGQQGQQHARSQQDITSRRTSAARPNVPPIFPQLDLHDRLGALPTPGLNRNTSNLGYFQHLTGNLSGTQTPLAAVAGAHFPSNPPLPLHNNSSHQHQHQHHHHHADSFSSISEAPSTRPTSIHETSTAGGFYNHNHPSSDAAAAIIEDEPASPPLRPDPAPEDLQVVFHVTYAGDIKMSLTAEVFLDYPMPSFVGIPLKLRITGLTFNGVGIVAYIKRRAHLCFLSPEDAEALVGGESVGGGDHDGDDGEKNAAGGGGGGGAIGGGGGSGGGKEGEKRVKVGGLLEDIKIESEMGQTEGGKQVLKNVGKIEKFILEQVQRIFEDEFVYPSFWTFLV